MPKTYIDSKAMLNKMLPDCELYQIASEHADLVELVNKADQAMDSKEMRRVLRLLPTCVDRDVVRNIYLRQFKANAELVERNKELEEMLKSCVGMLRFYFYQHTNNDEYLEVLKNARNLLENK